MQAVDKQMDLMTRSDLRVLLAAHDGPHVSIFMPTHRVWSDAPQDRIRLANLLGVAEARLADADMRPSKARDLLAPAYDLLEGRDDFWRHQSDGLALYLTPTRFFSYRLSLDLEELVIVGHRFHVMPLLRLFSDNGRFYVLALNQGRVRLWQGTHYSLGEVDLKEVPESLAEALRYDVFETHLQFHTGTGSRAERGERAAVFHGQGAAADAANIKKNMLRFFQAVDNGVCERLARKTAPLVLAGLSFMRGLYRDVNHYRGLIQDGIDGNPAEWSAEELHRRAWVLVEPLFQQARRKAADTYEQLAGTTPERVADEIETVVPAAYFHRIDTLFVPVGAYCWGAFNPERGDVEVHAEAHTGDDDLLDFAAVYTLLNDGTVYTVEPADMPVGAPVAAILRY